MRIRFEGTVQGVGFRPAVYRTAVSLGLHGKVWNDGSDVIVEIDDGPAFLDSFKKSVPPLAHIECTSVSDSDVDAEDFSIVSSETGGKGFSIPTDTAICGECLEDLRTGRRKGYAFTSCTSCGPRFTLLSNLPYDRSNTAMDAFRKCEECDREYETPSDRRFHHQTVCCPVCGPSYRLIDNDGLKDGDCIDNFVKTLESGGIGIVKSWGGMHICCIPSNIERMRKWYRRETKPFAIMADSPESIYEYGTPTEEELREIVSPHRPIVLIKKKHTETTDRISPSLDNIGVFLPYTGIQHLIFDRLQQNALIMTSANTPGEPMILDDEDILELNADAYLLHNQPIINRADDSVLRMFGDRTFFIRRSRGHIPSYLPFDLKGSAIAVGAQENIAGAVAVGGRIYPTQHIGNGEGIGVPEYLEQALRFQMSLVGCEPEAVAMDLHPAYATRKIAKKIASDYGSEIIEVQHHWAHAASLMTENGTDEAVALTLDGTGHGDDGNAWGGEVMYADFEKYKRLAHLEYIPLLGSDKALYDLKRLKFAIDSINGDENDSFSDSESAILRKMMNTSVKCSSMGRLLDAISYSLGVCTRRTYDGEPAMRLEPLLAAGNLVPGFETCTKNGIIKTAHLFSRIKKQQKPEDVAYSIVYNVMSEMVANAVEYADSEGISEIGITGGVSYNTAICEMFESLASSSGHDLIFHQNVPNGDGGISTGQAAIALKLIG